MYMYLCRVQQYFIVTTHCSLDSGWFSLSVYQVLTLRCVSLPLQRSLPSFQDGASYTCCEFMPSKQRYIFCGGKGGDLSLWDLKLNSIVKSYSVSQGAMGAWF